MSVYYNENDPFAAAWLLPVSAASAVTLTLPLIAGTAPGATPVTYGIGGNQEVCIMNLNNQSVVLAADIIPLSLVRLKSLHYLFFKRTGQLYLVIF